MGGFGEWVELLRRLGECVDHSRYNPAGLGCWIASCTVCTTVTDSSSRRRCNIYLALCSTELPSFLRPLIDHTMAGNRTTDRSLGRQLQFAAASARRHTKTEIIAIQTTNTNFTDPKSRRTLQNTYSSSIDLQIAKTSLHQALSLSMLSVKRSIVTSESAHLPFPLQY